MVLGHESAGTVIKLGPGVTKLKVGDRVAMEPGIPCRRCEVCTTGKYNLCQDVVFFATPPGNGTLTRVISHDEDFCFKLPDHVSHEEGALLEPLNVGVHACKRAGVTVGKKVLVSGAGPIGLLTMMSARAYGASAVAITDISQMRLDFAKEVGADHAVLADTPDGREMADKIISALGGQPDISIECSGAESAVRMAIFATKPGGVFTVIGHGKPDISIPMVNTVAKELDIRGSFRYCNDYQSGLDLVASGRVDVKKLITHRYTLEQTEDAYKTASAGEGIKVMISSARG